MASGTWLAALKRAFICHWNLLFVGAAVGAAAVSGRPDVILPLAGAAEVAYLALLSSNPRFQALAGGLERAPESAEAARLRDETELLRTLPAADVASFRRLGELCARLRRLSRGARGDAAGPDLQLQNIDRLLRIHLRLLVGKNTLERYFATVDEAQLQRDLARARERLASLAARGGDELRTARRRETLRDMAATFEKRLGNLRLARENHETIVLELERLGARLASAAEMGIARGDAAGVGREIDLVAASVEGTERAVREIESLTAEGAWQPVAARARPRPNQARVRA